MKLVGYGVCVCVCYLDGRFENVATSVDWQTG